MIRTHPSQPAFTGGEMSPLLLGRHDIERFLLGGQRVENFFVRHQGPLVRRRGAQFVRDLDCAQPRLVTFEFSRSESELLEIGCNQIVVGADAPESPGLASGVVFEQFDGPFAFPAWLFASPPITETGEGRVFYFNAFVSGRNRVRHSPVGIDPNTGPCQIEGATVGLSDLEFGGGMEHFIAGAGNIGLECTVKVGGHTAPYRFYPIPPAEVATVVAGSFEALLDLIGTNGGSFIVDRVFSYRLGDTYVQKFICLDRESPGFYVGNWINLVNCRNGDEVDYRFTNPAGPQDLGLPVARTGSEARQQYLSGYNDLNREYVGNKSRATFTVDTTGRIGDTMFEEFVYTVTPDVGEPYQVIVGQERVIASEVTTVRQEFPWIPGAQVYLTSWYFTLQPSQFDDFSSYPRSGDRVEFEDYPATQAWSQPTTFLLPQVNHDHWDDFRHARTGAVVILDTGHGWPETVTFIGYDRLDAFHDLNLDAVGEVTLPLELGVGWAGPGFTALSDYRSHYDAFDVYANGAITVLDNGNTDWIYSGSFLLLDYSFANDEFDSYTNGTITSLSGGTGWSGNGTFI